MNKPCKYCGCLSRDTLQRSTYDSSAYAYCPVIGANVNVNGTCADDAKRLAYTGKMHFVEIDMEESDG